MAKLPMIIVNETIPLVVKMSPNPNSVSIDRSKVYSKTQTLGGWVFEHWGEQPRTMRVKGRTQAVLGSGASAENTTSGVEGALFSLQQIYTMDKRPVTSWLTLAKKFNPLAGKIKDGTADSATLKTLSSTFIYYKLDLYTGFFTSFSFQQDGEQSPRHYEYEFQFMITASAQNAVTNKLFSGSLAPAAGIGSSIGSIKGIGGLNI